MSVRNWPSDNEDETDGLTLTPEFPYRLRNLMESMPSLSTLEFILPEETMDVFEVAFADSQLPSITHLTLSPYSHFLISKCPSVRVVQTYTHFPDSKRGRDDRSHTYELISATSGTKLECLSICEEWVPDQTEGERSFFVSRVRLISLRLSAF